MKTSQPAKKENLTTVLYKNGHSWERVQMCVRENMHPYYKLNDMLRGRQIWSQRAAARSLLRNSRACLPSPWCWIVRSSGGWLLDHGAVPAFDFAVGPGTFSQSQPSWSCGSASWCSFREHSYSAPEYAFQYSRGVVLCIPQPLSTVREDGLAWVNVQPHSSVAEE